MCNLWQSRGDLSKFLSTGAVGITGTKLGRLCWVALAVCLLVQTGRMLANFLIGWVCSS